MPTTERCSVLYHIQYAYRLKNRTGLVEDLARGYIGRYEQISMKDLQNIKKGVGNKSKEKIGLY